MINCMGTHKRKTNSIIRYNELSILLIRLNQYLGKELTASEGMLFRYYLDRTVRFHNDWEFISNRQTVTDGIVSDTYVCGPVPISTNSLPACKKRLIEKGFISSSKSEGKNDIIIIDVAKIHEILDMSKLNISKKYHNKSKNSDQMTTGSDQMTTGSDQMTTTNNENINNGNINNGKDQEIPPTRSRRKSIASVENLVEDIKTKSRTKRKKVLSTKRKFSKTSFRSVWCAAEAEFAEHHNITALGLSHKKPGIIFNAYQNEAIFKSPEWQDYITDSVVNWSEYVHHLQKRYKHLVPEHPDFMYLHYHHRDFLKVYREHRTGSTRVITSSTAKLDKLTSDNLQLQKELKDLKEANSLQSIANNESYLDRVARTGLPQGKRAKVKNNNYEPDYGFDDEDNW